MDTLTLRFRSATGGDVGPFSFHDSQLIQACKEKLFQEWPKEGPLAKDPPQSANDIKLILGGKYVDSTKPLKDYRKDMGEIKADTLVTMHIVVRPAAQPAKAAAGAGTPQESKTGEPQRGGGGCCIIS